MKSYTDIEQSKKLSEILPLESADMCYIQDLLAGGKYGDYKPYIGNLIPAYGQDKIKCWSLAALLNILPIVYINSKNEVCGPLHIDITDSETPFVLWYVNPLHKGSIVELKTKEYNNLVDACYEMILRLNELNLL